MLDLLPFPNQPCWAFLVSSLPLVLSSVFADPQQSPHWLLLNFFCDPYKPFSSFTIPARSSLVRNHPCQILFGERVLLNLFITLATSTRSLIFTLPPPDPSQSHHPHQILLSPLNTPHLNLLSTPPRYPCKITLGIPWPPPLRHNYWRNSSGWEAIVRGKE